MLGPGAVHRSDFVGLSPVCIRSCKLLRANRYTCQTKTVAVSNNNVKWVSTGQTIMLKIGLRKETKVVYLLGDVELVSETVGSKLWPLCLKVFDQTRPTANSLACAVSSETTRAELELFGLVCKDGRNDVKTNGGSFLFIHPKSRKTNLFASCRKTKKAKRLRFAGRTRTKLIASALYIRKRSSFRQI